MKSLKFKFIALACIFISIFSVSCSRPKDPISNTTIPDSDTPMPAPSTPDLSESLPISSNFTSYVPYVWVKPNELGYTGTSYYINMTVPNIYKPYDVDTGDKTYLYQYRSSGVNYTLRLNACIYKITPENSFVDKCYEALILDTFSNSPKELNLLDESKVIKGKNTYTYFTE